MFHRDNSGAPSSTCASLVLNKERTLCWYEGASGKYSLDHLRTNLSLIEKSGFLYTTAYFLLTKPDALDIFVDIGVRQGKPIAFNLSAHYVIHNHKQKIDEIIQFADFVFCNEDEAKVYAEVHSLTYD